MKVHGKPVVIFAGAGISKEAPANLFGWWEYNRLIIDEIGKAGARVAGIDGNLLNADEVLQKMPVTAISDFLFNYSAGKAYFSLIKILEGSHPNRNHHLLVQLAEKGEISGVITTNFDTLIEQAFAEHGLSCFVYLSEEDYVGSEYKGFPIYKIHGSVTDTDTAIDTVQQKLQGLSEAKNQLLSRVFLENHIIFMGFSGEDFAFGHDYFPITDAKRGITWVLNPIFGKPHSGLQWIEHPCSYEDLSIFIRKNVDRIDDFKLCVATIPEFCAYMGWEIAEISEDVFPDETRSSARQVVREFLRSIAVTEWGCAGMCMEILRTVKGDKEALGLAMRIDKVLSERIHLIQGQEGYIILPLVEQTVSDLITEAIEPGIEQITEMDRLMPLCDTMADIFKTSKMYNKSMKYYDFSLRITNQRFLEYIVENNYAKLKKSYNNMATTKMRMGRMLAEIGRYDNASRFFAEAMQDALSAGAFYNIASAYLCHVEMDLTMMHDKDALSEQMRSYRLSNVDRLYADMWCVIRLARKAGNSRTLCQVYFYMMILFVDLNMFSYIPLIMEHIKSYAKITPESARYLKVINELKSDLPDDIERAEKFPSDLQYCEPKYETIWEDCRERDILSTKEGKEAYRKVCLGRNEEARNLLKETADRYYGICISGNHVSDRRYLYLAEMFSYCYIKLEAKNQNSFGIKEAEIYLLRCLKLEINLWQTENLTETTAYLSQYYYGMEAYSEALLYAEFCLCLCDNPIAHGLILISCAIAALSCINLNKKPDAAHYGNMYFQLEKQFPQASDPVIHEYLRDWLNGYKTDHK